LTTEDAERALLAERILAEQEERRRLAELLHDGPVQQLSALTQMVDAALETVREGMQSRADEILERAVILARNTTQDLRALCDELEPRALRELGFAPQKIELVERMILATKRHERGDLPQEALAFLDADLSILGTDRERYDEYVRQVRKEYAHVPDDAFRTGRNAILRTFLERPRLYFTDEFFERFEASARANLYREVSLPVGASASPV
jgi:predicted metal-dependent HD superfamily phosphohydrolase